MNSQKYYYADNADAAIPDANTKREAIEEAHPCDDPPSRQERNRQAAQLALRLMALPPVDLQNPVQVERRVAKYFTLCGEFGARPAIAGLAAVLGVSRQHLVEVGSGGVDIRIPKATAQAIRKAYCHLEQLWESYMLEGSIGTNIGMFIGKNQFAYKEKLDMRPTRAAKDEGLTPEEMRRRARELHVKVAGGRGV